jgi:hypothetical protein
MSTFVNDDEELLAGAQTESKMSALSAWWNRHCKSFSLWYLSLSAEHQLEVLSECVDMPVKRKKSDEQMTAADLLLPELVGEDLAGNSFETTGCASQTTLVTAVYFSPSASPGGVSQGRGLVILMTSRLVSSDRFFSEDIALLHDRFVTGRLPLLSQGALSSLRLPFVDRADPSEAIQYLPIDVSEEREAEVAQQIDQGLTLVHAEVWLALRVV